MSLSKDFEQAAKRTPPGWVREFFAFLACHKKWWLLPVVAVILLLGALVTLSSSPLAPFVYTLF
ncbi:MAG: hypothetical protein C4297_03980 [Gemmataceae bacterium]